MFIVNQTLNEVTFDYTHCSDLAGTTLSAPPASVSSTITAWQYNATQQTCTIQFRVPKSLYGGVFMYIRISNMYQNNRLYVKSLDPDQLAGKIYSSASDFSSSLESNCRFLLYANCTRAATSTWTGNLLSYASSNPDCLATNKSQVVLNADYNAQYYPCGLIANSMFTDTISDLLCVDQTCRIPTFAFSASGIAWPEDKAAYGKTGWATNPTYASQIPTMLIPPPQWRQAWPALYGNGYNSSNIPDLGNWERLQVWMRTAGLPQFRKLWGRNDSETLDAGLWQVSIIDGKQQIMC